ncbi:MAG TPA: hypothetical protein C5S37_13820, partial [Methanophagales archaeon]|nr:hypothetical protein [Methanophagales archaeon]
GEVEDRYHRAMGWHYSALADIAESSEERAELYKKSAEEFKEGEEEDRYHWAMGWHYSALARATESLEERAELYKKSADEFKEGEKEDLYHWAMGWHYSALASATESLEERAGLEKKSADEFKEGEEEDLYHWAMGYHYSALARATESLEERAELHKKAAEEFKAGKLDELSHQAMAWHYYLLSLQSEVEEEKGDFKLKAVEETDWLFIANIALSLSKISKTGEIIRFMEDAISSYENHLHEKGEKLPKFPIFIDGNFRDEKTVEDVTKKLKSYFVPKISPFLKNRPIEVEELDNMIERNDFILMLVENNVNEILSFEMGLAYTAGKPVVLFVSGDISHLNPLFLKAATITQKLEYAITVLRLFSIIKSGEILEVGREEGERIAAFFKSIERIEIPQPKIEFPSYIEEKEKMADFLKPIERIEIPEKIELKPSLTEEEMPLKEKQGRLRGDKV